MTDHLIEVEPGVEIFASDLGAGDPVVLLHGWGLGHEVWDRQVCSLAAIGRRAIGLDLRGHGRSSKPLEGYQVERLGADVIAVIEALGLSRVSLVGWSLGGLSAFRVATARPDLVDRLVLVCSNGVAAARHPDFPFGHTAAAVEAPLVALELSDRPGSREQQIRNGFGGAPPEPMLRWLSGLAMRVPSWAGIACLRTLFYSNQVAALPALQAPLVQIVGEGDPVVSRRAANWLIEQVPGARQIAIEAGGHFPMFQAPEAFDRALIEALEGGI